MAPKNVKRVLVMAIKSVLEGYALLDRAPLGCLESILLFPLEDRDDGSAGTGLGCLFGS